MTCCLEDCDVRPLGSAEGQQVVSHLALNSSKDSSWCSLRRRVEVVKVGRAMARGRTAAVDRTVVARRMEVAGPRAAIRRKDIFFFIFLPALFVINRGVGGADRVVGEQTGQKDD